MKEELIKLPKVELHIHLDGGVSEDLAWNLTPLTKEEIKERMIAPDKCANLSEYLTKFDFPGSIMQTKENLRLISKDLIDRLQKQNVIYTEIRLAPMFHTNNGLTYEEVVESVLEGMAEYYILNLAREVEKGKMENALKCNHVGGIPPLGYVVDKATRKLVINENEAKAVRLIFRKVIECCSYGDI